MTSKIALGRFHKVTLTDAFPTEDRNFTPWLASDENIGLLGDALRRELEVEAVEHWVGPFRADIIARVTDETEHRVLIENQFGRTDHRHLGQIMTYLAGIESAKTVVWIAESFQHDHRAAIDWLNSHTDDEFEFFGVEIELWRIGDSAPAPRFNVVASPNNWTRQAKTAVRAAEGGAERESHQIRLAYWGSFGRFLDDRKSHFRIRTPNRDHWRTFPIGRAGFNILATISTSADRIGVELYASDDLSKAAFHLLHEQRADVEHEFGAPLEWQELPGKKAWRVAIFRQGCDPSDAQRYPEFHQWMLDQMMRFESVFKRRVRELVLPED